ncbi:MAG TPA: lipopolysaccharide kinase InaA family protein [Gemmatimonadaceae bacterium]|nr:lipopolysaccharide kinase InaA family protein [Gemmatimonadaceae bacterium]
MVPAGYERLLLGHAIAVTRSDVAQSIRRSLVSADGTRCTLHEYAARHPAARVIQGREPAYAVPLPPPRNKERVVVRHNRHGGLFRSLTGDLFLSPTRAPYELEISIELAKRGVPTPDVMAYALYPPGGLFQRADVCTREVPEAHDLAHALERSNPGERNAALSAAARLVAVLSLAGARHHDLNAKNILVARDTAYVLDVDRVTLGGRAESLLNANLARLTRSLRKWRDRFGVDVSEQEIQELESGARSASRAGTGFTTAKV